MTGDRFFFTHEHNGDKHEKGFTQTEREMIQPRRLSDMFCDNMEIDSIGENLFDFNQNIMQCSNKNELIPFPVSSMKGIYFFLKSFEQI